MKNLIILICCLVVKVSFGQTDIYISSKRVDSLVFEYINVFRIHNNVKSIKWDDKVYKAAQHHTTYMVKTGTLSHEETIKVEGLDSLYSPTDRGMFYGTVSLAENCASGEPTIFLDTNECMIDRQLKIAKKSLAKFTQDTYEFLKNFIFDI
jgi:hypothetical protein